MSFLQERKSLILDGGVTSPPSSERKYHYHKLEGWLEKRGEKAVVGTLGKGWKRRYFELDEHSLHYYMIDAYQTKERKGSINIADIKTVAPKEPNFNSLNLNSIPMPPEKSIRNSMNTESNAGEEWEFYIDTVMRRYELRTLEGEHVMWKWIEGLRSAQSRLLARKRTEELQQRQQQLISKKQTEDQYVISEMQQQLKQFKDTYKRAEEEWKSYANGFKRKFFQAKKDLQAKDRQISELSDKCQQLTKELATMRACFGVEEDAAAAPTLESQPEKRPISTSTGSNLSKSSSLLTNSTFSTSSELLLEKDSPNSLADSVSANVNVDEEESKLYELIHEADDEIKTLKTKLKEKDEILKQQTSDIKRIKEEADLLRHTTDLRREALEADVAEIQAKLELEQNAVQTLQKNLHHLEHENRSLRRTVSRSQYFGNPPSADVPETALYPPWVPDVLREGCKFCQSSFTLFKRRHHCRQCGDIFCSKCSANFVVLPDGLYPHVRIRLCDGCFSTQCKK